VPTQSIVSCGGASGLAGTKLLASSMLPLPSYKHCSDKASLFSEIVTTAVGEAADPVHDDVPKLEDSGDVEADLQGLARQLQGRVMQPRILQLRRLVIGEAGRFPGLARTFYEQGPGRTIAALAIAFERFAARGVLHLDDPLLAAELDRYADAGVRTFLAAYGKA
jgi:TetR/AcrR family transcriptional repressor of mexJK operon